MMPERSEFQGLQAILDAEQGLELAVLIGSRASRTACTDSDWDIAIRWVLGIGFMEKLARTEVLRRKLEIFLDTGERTVDLIDIPTARLAMRSVVAEEGVLLKGTDSLGWHHFLQRTWREMEEHYWEQTYAA
jgi:predicted nucleotidyltransferase